MAIDLTKIEGLTPEQITAITAAHELDVTGLKNNNEKLIKEKQDQKELADAEKTRADTAAAEAAQAKIDKATKDKDFEALTSAIAEKDAIITTQKAEFAESEKLSIIETAKNDFISKHVIRDDPAATSYMRDIVGNGLDVRDGNLVNVNDKGLTGVSVENYFESVVGDKAFSKYIVGTNASGGGAGGGHSNGGAGAKEMSRQDFDNLGAGEKSAFSKDGGKLTD